MRERQKGQVLVIVAVWMLALIGSTALVLLTGSVEWQRNQLQQIADQAALDGALKIGVGCTAASANTVITQANASVAAQRGNPGTGLGIAGAGCATTYTGTNTFAGGLSETIHYPYRRHQQQVEVILSVALPISFGSYMGANNTTVTRRAVAQQLSGSTTAVSATRLSCTGGQVNVGGSILASNNIALSGNCGLYAHARLDAASGTYSDLGNVSVYAPGQTWVGGAGTCAVNPSNAVCSDGFELSGHVTMKCGTSGTSAYLSAADALINPNPCAGGTGPQPVAPLTTNLPPDPNTDPAAIGTLVGTGGAACSALGVYPNIVVGGVTVATGLAPAPTKDLSGFYHFKPSCYGFIDPSSLSVPGGGGITNRQSGPEVGPTNGNITATIPANSKVGTLLVVVIRSDPDPLDRPFTAPAGWVQAVTAEQDGAAHTDIWYYPNNPGNIKTAIFGATATGVVAQMTEWNGVLAVAPLDRTGTTTIAAQQKNATVQTSAAILAKDLVITNVGFASQGAGNNYTPGAGWNSLTKDPNRGFGSEYRVDLAAGVAKETVTYDSDTTWSLVIAAFKPAGGVGGGGSGAVLDPGFYYFNGSGFPGGGGICLNSGILLARDVTLEFVKQAGFSTGTCAAGGGGGCAAGSCQFGSLPCAISPCPPNTRADPLAALGPNTWFAAPCSAAPPAVGTQDTSCTASSWCLNGDRACTRVLMWTPAGATGEIAITGAAAKAWLLGSVFWAGTCTDRVNGTSTLDGTISCGMLSISAAAGARTAVGSDYGISTALVEANLVE